MLVNTETLSNLKNFKQRRDFSDTKTLNVELLVSFSIISLRLPELTENVDTKEYFK